MQKERKGLVGSHLDLALEASNASASARMLCSAKTCGQPTLMSTLEKVCAAANRCGCASLQSSCLCSAGSSCSRRPSILILLGAGEGSASLLGLLSEIEMG